MGRAPHELEAVLDQLLGALERRLGEDAEQTLEAWRALDALRGRWIEWAQGSGLAEGVDGNGRLVVALEEGGHTALSAGEVHLRRGV